MKNFNLSKWTQNQSTAKMSDSFLVLLATLEATLVNEFNANINEYKSIFDLIDNKESSQNVDEQAFWSWMKRHGAIKLQRVLSNQSIEQCFSFFDCDANDMLEYRLFLLKSDLESKIKTNIVDSVVDTIDELYDFVCHCKIIVSDIQQSYEDIFKIDLNNLQLKKEFDLVKSLPGGISFFLSKFYIGIKMNCR